MTKAKVDNKSNGTEKKSFESFEDRVAAHIELSVQNKKIDPESMATLFSLEDSAISFPNERNDALWAQTQINSANQKIRELNDEIAKQKLNISKFNCLIQNYKRIVKTDKLNNRGRPVREGYREEIARAFTKKWVASLMESLEVKSCGAEGGLAKVVSSTQERNWRRWLSGDAIPSYSTFENLLDAEITCGKYSGEQLFKVPVTPTHDQILTLLQFI